MFRIAVYMAQYIARQDSGPERQDRYSLRRPLRPAALGLGLLLILGGACGGETPPAEKPGIPPANVPEPDDTLATPTPLDLEAGPPPPPDSAFLALMTPEQTAEIKALSVPLVLPTSIPAGFAVERVSTTSDSGVTGYQVLYRDGGDRCFVVEYTTAGVGSSPSTDYRLPITAPLFDDGTAYGLNYGSYTDSELRRTFPEPDLMSDWLSLETGAYRLAGAAYINDRLAPPSPCKDVTPEEAVRIVESSALITDELIGDD